MSDQDNKQTEELGTSCAYLLGKVLGIIAAFALCAWAGMWLWNACLVAVFPVIPEVSYFQFCGIYILCNILFSSRKLTSTNDKK